MAVLALAGGGAFALWRRRALFSARSERARQIARTTPAPPLPPGWEGWAGARPEPGGWPQDTILALPGLERLTPSARAALVDLCAELRIPVDSMAVVISRESGFRADALNPLPAAGLIQLTTGARLPGFDSETRIREITTWSAERQVRWVVGPFYRRLARRAAGANPAELYMLNFLPGDAGKPLDFRLGDRESEESFRRKVYEWNSGFDKSQPKRGYFTVADVHQAVRRSAAGAGGKRMTLDGTVITISRSAVPETRQESVA
ncbi:hypothetical protein [Sorangium sp. So ce131]|uniref:hypothetical protein n=1 Tax=Sorangium sp. So ce131 TaxID=3133282 RepID=UPI003F625988